MANFMRRRNLFLKLIDSRNCVKRLLICTLLVTSLVSCSRGTPAEEQKSQGSAERLAEEIRPVRAFGFTEAVGAEVQTIEAESTALQNARPTAPIYRFIEPQAAPLQMGGAEIARELNDPWWTLVLSQSPQPLALSDLIDAVTRAAPGWTRNNYLVGEGSQISISEVPRDENRFLRYALVWKEGSIAKILASSAPPSTRECSATTEACKFLQVISWDDKKKSFNFYERFRFEDGTPFWAWTGDSGYARREPHIGKGCFDCHHNGVPIMKELTRPWNNWQSELANIPADFVPEEVVADPPFNNLQSASELETEVKSAATLFTKHWLDRRVDTDQGIVQDVPEILRHLTMNTTVNMGSSLQRSQGDSSTKITLPADFFVFDSFFRSLEVGLNYDFPSDIAIDQSVFSNFIKDNNFRLVNCRLKKDKSGCANPSSYAVQGTTFFAGFVPLPANDDVTAFLFSSGIGDPPGTLELLSKKFVVSVLLVDFQNPVFSQKRASLQAYARMLNTAEIVGRESNIPELFAAKVSQAATGPPCSEATFDSCTAEQQFLYFWKADDWKERAERAISSYLQAVSSRIQSPAGASEYLGLGNSRRLELASTPDIQNLYEFSLLLPDSDLPRTLLEMGVDGTVRPKGN